MKYIVYKTTCLVNSKIYIGYHQTSNPEVFDGYLGCGYYITTQKVDRVRIQVTPLNGKLNRYTLDGKYIDSFESAAQAKKVLGLKLASISQAIRLNRQCNGFRWTRTDSPTETINISH